MLVVLFIGLFFVLADCEFYSTFTQAKLSKQRLIMRNLMLQTLCESTYDVRRNIRDKATGHAKSRHVSGV